MIHVLTGAGFSSNIGTPLAREVSDQVFSVLHGRGETVAAERVKSEGGFEEACAGLERTNSDLLAIKEAVVEVFRQIDEAHKLLAPEHAPNTHLGACMRSMMRLLTLVGDKGSVFTTNFDMLVERYLWICGNQQFVFTHPYYQDNGLWFRKGARAMQRADASCKYLGDAKCPDGRLYVKLHGSLDWTDSGQSPVVGVSKRDDVLSHSALKRYWDIFHDRMTESGARLIVIGYGFNDEFVNEVLIKGVSAGELRLFIWDTLPMTDMIEKLGKLDARLPGSLAGYCSQPISSRFPANLSEHWLGYCPDLKAFVTS